MSGLLILAVPALALSAFAPRTLSEAAATLSIEANDDLAAYGVRPVAQLRVTDSSRSKESVSATTLLQDWEYTGGKTKPTINPPH